MPVVTGDRLLTVRDLCQLLGVNKLAVYEMVRKGQLPRPMQPGGRRMYWTREEVERALLASWAGPEG
jgi:excisionase family DNA binding protein